MLRRTALLLAVAMMLSSPAAPATAQSPPAFSVAYEAAAGYRPVVRVGDVLAEPALEDAVRAGLPLRLRFKVELWRDAFFDELVGTESWTVVVYYEPLSTRFLIRSRSPARTVRVTSFSAVRSEINGGYPLSLRPGRSGRFYYTAQLDVETLSLSDLEELEKWLQGELRPAVSGEGSVGGAVGEGMRRLLIRVLALPERRFEARSAVFRVAGG